MLNRAAALLGEAFDELELAAEIAEEGGADDDALRLREAAALVIEAARTATFEDTRD